MSYKHISAEDRIVIATLLDESRTKAYVARRLGVDRSTIGREIKRNASKLKHKAAKLVARPRILDIDGRKSRGSGFTKTKYAAMDVYNQAIAKQVRNNGFTTPA